MFYTIFNVCFSMFSWNKIVFRYNRTAIYISMIYWSDKIL